MMKIVTVLGARPQFIKVGSISREILRQQGLEKNIQEITDEINYFFEKKITEDPGQYFWLHDRWK